MPLSKFTCIPLVACVVAAASLIFLISPGTRRFPDETSLQRAADELQRLQTANTSLETQLIALQNDQRDGDCASAATSTPNGAPAENIAAPQMPVTK